MDLGFWVLMLGVLGFVGVPAFIVALANGWSPVAGIVIVLIGTLYDDDGRLYDDIFVEEE